MTVGLYAVLWLWHLPTAREIDSDVSQRSLLVAQGLGIALVIFGLALAAVGGKLT